MNKTPNFTKLAEEALKDLPQSVADLAQLHFEISFEKKGFTNFAFAAWPLRKDSEGHELMGKSGTLAKSIRQSQVNMKIIEIVAGEGIPYAQIHNEGGKISVPVTKKMKRFFWYLHLKTKDDKYKYMALTKKERLLITIPKRQYIGESHTLNQQIEQLWVKAIINAQKGLKFK